MKLREKILRFSIIVLGAVMEVAIAIILFSFFSEKFAWIEVALRLISVILVISVINNSRHLSSDMIWILLIILFPVPGTLIYLVLGANLIVSKTAWNLVAEEKNARKYYKQDVKTLQELYRSMPDIKGSHHYISQSSGFPIYRNTGFDYYSLGDMGYPVMLEEMRKAKSFIFLEYFIIEQGVMWDGMHDILKQKAGEGLDIRVMYDDLGSMHTLPASYANMLEKEGIKCVRFNKINPILGTIMNHRDHRKIMVVDGKTAFSGGINLADEYINKKEVYGHWKDNCIRIQGEAVWSYTVMFLTNWNALRKTDTDYEVFRANVDASVDKYDGYIAPYGETPLDDENTGQSIYMNILNSANDYVYICTPYLIIDTELENALILTAKKGVDVRIMTPGIPDKKLVWHITRSFYRNLIDSGVKIYEYTPGFNHAKVFVSDDRVATVGTINLDYRSLYLHYENGTYLCASEKILSIRDDFVETCKLSHRMKKTDIKENIFQKILVGIAKLFAAQM